ncbi:MAG: hypothetical protein QXR89_05865 [Candidatus Bathyarchaeia archaeon]
MEKKILFPLTIIMIATLMPMLIQKAECIANVEVYGYTDKLQYMPGETITLKLWVYNKGPDEIVLKNVTVYLPWYSLVWGGNYTVDAQNAVLSKDHYWNTTISDIEIPTDGRADSGNIKVVVTYAIGSVVYTPEFRNAIPLSIIETSYTYTLLENMDKLLTLLTVLTVLVIVCTIIVAAVIFFSTRRPRAIWVEEEEKEEKSK